MVEGAPKMIFPLVPLISLNAHGNKVIVTIYMCFAFL